MRKLVYLVVMAVFAAGVYFFLGKKDASQTSTPSESVPAEVSAEQGASEGVAQAEAASETEHAGNDVSANFGKLSDFTLTNQLGQEFKLSAMNGNVLLFNFFFSTCKGPCPLMNKKMEALQEKFANDANVKLVSITVDPAHDTAEVLKAYAETFKANPEKWFFLTGSKESIHDVMQKQMKLGGAEDVNTHSTRIVLVDKDGSIKGYYDSASEEELAKLEVDARQLATAANTAS